MIIAGMNLGPHWGFIVAAYVVALLGVCALMAWIFVDYSSLKHRLAAMEAQGMRRRSQQGNAEQGKADSDDRG